MIKYFLYGGVLLLWMTTCKRTTERKHTQPPNILFIMTDDHGYQAMSAYDERYVQTPNLDRIAKEGVLFLNSFVSNSICAPSRAVMLTGKHSHVNGQINNMVRFDSTQLTFPKLLQATGYQTAVVGKWHLKTRPTGFDHYEVLIGQGNYYNADFIENGERRRSAGYVTDVITDKGLRWLAQRNPDQPFCLLVHHKATHRVWMPDTALLDLFAGVEFPLPASFFDNYAGRPAAAAHMMGVARDLDIVYDLKMLDPEGELQTQYRPLFERFIGRMNAAQRARWDAHYDPIIADFKERGLAGEDLARWKFQRYLQDYLKCVVSVDRNVGRLLDYLDEQGLTENTLVVYTSDQGFYLGEHGWFDKRFMYEPSLRTPLAIRYPAAVRSGQRIEALVQNIDYAPTLLDFAQVAVPPEMQGRSLRPLVREAAVPWREAIYYHYLEFPNEHGTKKHYGIRTKRYKLIHFYGDIDVWEFYDLAEDPGEMINQYDNPAYRKEVVQLRTELRVLQKKYGDQPVPLPEAD